MANKRDTAKQKRARQNRAQRAALEARTKGSAPARPSRVAPSTAERLKRSAEERPTSGTQGDEPAAKDTGKGKGKGRAKRERPARRGDSPVDVETLEGGWFTRMSHVPGGTQAMFAGVMAIVATGIVSFTKVFVAEADRDEFGRDAKATMTIFEAYDPAVSAALVLLPLAVVGLALWFSFHPQRRRIWLGAAVILGFLAATVLQFYLFVAGFFAYAVFRASRVEGPNKPIAQVAVEAVKRRRGTLVDEDDEDDGDDEDLDDSEDDADDMADEDLIDDSDEIDGEAGEDQYETLDDGHGQDAWTEGEDGTASER